MQRVYEGDESRIDATVLYYMVTPPPAGDDPDTLLGTIDEQGQVTAEIGLYITDLGSGLESSTPKTMVRSMQAIYETKQELAWATEQGNHEAALQLREKRKQLEDYCAKISNRNGQVRLAGETNERTRKAVQKEIRRTLKRIETTAPLLATYLKGQIGTGTTCFFRKDPSIDWQVYYSNK